tara:strand:+ start:16577 stop:20383 length:3807 start_codon:yes stop_codon:yes gene_type:complete
MNNYLTLNENGDEIMSSIPIRDTVSVEDSDDKLIRERAFKISDSVELADILISKTELELEEQTEKRQIDEALGDIFDPFAENNEKSPGYIRRDGTVINEPETDLTTSLAQEGERKVNWILMVSMILLFSGVSIVAGIALEPFFATILLLLLTIMGFVLGEMWIPKKNLHLLGVTWIIISMKVLYGLAIEFQRWNIISLEVLGGLLVGLVGFNVYLSYRHNHDAIAAQSTLILLAIGSVAGYSYGEIGIALMILTATILVHGLAWHRKSGNLAALGIASTYLWVGMHALTEEISIGSLRILPLDEPLLLFVLMIIISGVNASMAAIFAKDENWFSKAFKALGLGEPGLWGVSVSLGMIGALMAVGANRQDVGYALGLISILASSFGGSYLVVRGINARRVSIPLLISSTLMTIFLVVNETENMLSFDSYEVFAVIGIFVTGFLMIRDQHQVTDRVLWTGSIGIVILLVIMIPANQLTDSSLCLSECSSGDGGLLLLSTLSLVHIGTGYLAIKRKSPSLGGVTVILPWAWVMIEEILEEGIRTIIVANGNSDPGSIIHLDPIPLLGYFSISSLLMIIVNYRLGANEVNLASKFLGVTEISASIRDSGLLQLWSIGLWLPLVVVIFMSNFEGFTAITILIVLCIITALHLISEIVNKRIGNSNVMLSTLAIGYLLVQWQYGLDEVLMIIYCLTTGLLFLKNNGDKNSVYSIGMTLMGVPMLVSLISRGQNELTGTDALPEIGISKVSILCTAIIISSYLIKINKIEKLLNPSLASLWLLTINIALVYNLGNFSELIIALGLFGMSTIWMVANGEVRRELKSITRRDNLKDLARKRVDLGVLSSGGVKEYDSNLLEIRNRRSKSREMVDTDDLEELYLTEATHKPLIIMLVLALVIVSSSVVSFVSGVNQLLLLISGIFMSILILIARQRTRELGLELPHFLGMEIPVAVSISGVILIQVSGHLSPGMSNSKLFDMAIMVLLIALLCIISLVNQKNLIERIAIAIDWFLIPIFAGRITAAILYESLPAPLTVNPTTGDFIEWILPWSLLESLLILSVILLSWLETKRNKKGLEPSNKNVIRTVAIVFVSTGPAGLLAILTTLYHTIKHEQISEFGFVAPMMILPLISLSNIVTDINGIEDNVTLMIGLGLLLFCALTVPLKREIWTMVLAVDAHIMLYTGIIWTGIFTTIYLPIILISLSTIIWVIGILQLRKILRFWGLFDLVIAVISSLLLLGSEMLDPVVLLISLIVLAAELGLVTWLSLSNEEELIKD